MVIIRKYQRGDRNFIRKICCDTAFFGEPSERFFDGREVLADSLTLYYTDYEPESLFVAEINGEIAGYLTGCKSIRAQKRVSITKIIPFIAVKFIFSGAILKKRNILFLYNCLLSFLKGEFFTDDVSSEYPSTLHINIDAKYRRMGIGRKLMNEYFSYIKNEDIKGIHLTTISSDAVKFFEEMGFKVLQKKKVSYFHYLRDEKLYRFILGRKLI